MKAFIVVGLGFGDEGKGLTTDYLCSKSESPIVIRFNGGHQAGHCVVLKNNEKHIFSNFGSGTLRQIPTYWSKYCTLEPMGFINEYNNLRKRYNPSIYIDLNCQVTTHYDILFNRATEISLGSKKRGSCGVGFGDTIDRSEIDLSFTFEDMLDENLCISKLQNIRKYYKSKINLETKFDFNDFAHDETDTIFLNLTKKIKRIIYKGFIIPANEEDIFLKNNTWKTYIFEGAQGILLDKEFGIKPHITKSNTSSKNAIEILLRNEFSKKEIEIFYVTRVYQTRHGAGPFKLSNEEFILQNTWNETNKRNVFQGEFKYNYLDIDDLNYAISCDRKCSEGIVKNIMLTCLDQLRNEEIIHYDKGKIQSIHYTEIQKKMRCNFNSINYSFGNCSDKVISVNLNM